MTNEQILSAAMASVIKHMSKDPVRSQVIANAHAQLLSVPLQTLLSSDVHDYFIQRGEDDRLNKDTMDELRFRTKLTLGFEGHEDIYAAWKSALLAEIEIEDAHHDYVKPLMFQPWIEGLWLLCAFKGYFSPKS